MTAPILLAGDTHGNGLHLMRTLVPAALTAGCDRIIVCGDFGFFWDTIERAQKIADGLAGVGLELWFLDGNHENFDLMADVGFYPDMLGMDVEGYDAGPVTSDDVPNLTYLPRGATFEWDGLTFMAFGGAVSIDKSRRREHISWWSQELITEGQVRRVEDAAPKVDILLSHDVPEGVPTLERYLHDGFQLPYKLDQLSRQNRAMMRRVYEAVEPRMVFHGHYHFPYTDWLGDTRVQGLNCDGTGPSSYTILSPKTTEQDPA